MTETDRALSRLVGLVVVVAALLLTAAAVLALGEPMDVNRAILALALILLVTVSGLTSVQVRVRATMVGTSWTETAILIAFSVLHVPYAVLVVFAGSLIGKLFRRLELRKVAFGAGKDTILAGAAGAVFYTMGFPHKLERPVDVLPYAAAFAAVILADDLISIPVMALATRTSVREIFGANLDIRLLFSLIRFAVAIIALFVLQVEPLLLLGIGPIALSLHLTHQGRVRARAERLAWQQLAEATDAFNAVQMDVVLQTAVSKGSRLFSADQVEVETWIDEANLVIRGLSLIHI